MSTDGPLHDDCPQGKLEVYLIVEVVALVYGKTSNERDYGIWRRGALDCLCCRVVLRR